MAGGGGLVLLGLLAVVAALAGCTGSGRSVTAADGGAGQLHLAFIARPYDTVAGTRMRPVRVAVLDATNRRVRGPQPVVTMSMADGRGTLGGTLAVQACQGEATFDDLVAGSTGRGYALVASAPGRPSITSHTFQVTEMPSGLVSIEVVPPGPTLASGSGGAMRATGIFGHGQRRDVTCWATWTSGDPTLATVTAAGTVTGVRAGPATMAARIGGVTGTARLEVTSAVLTSLAVVPSSPTIPSNTDKPLAAIGTYSDGSAQDLTSSVYWSSSDEQVATALPGGVVSATGAGTTWITAATATGVTGSTLLTVTPSGPVGPCFSTYLGGRVSWSSANPLTFAQSTAVDSGGCTYVTGATSVSDLPLVNASQSSPSNGSTWTGFVAKYSPEGEVLWCTYLGGDGQTMGVGIGVLPNGWVAVSGLTSSARDFPILNAAQAVYGGNVDAFLTVYDAGGTLVYSTYIGGKDLEGPSGTFTDDNTSGNPLAVDAQGLVYVTSETNSTDFPLTPNAIQRHLNLDGKSDPTPADAFACIFDPSKSGPSSRIYSSFMGGENSEKGHAVTVDPGGTFITVVGYTASRRFPTTPNGYRSTPPPGHFASNGFVAQFTPSDPGSPTSLYSMRYSTYLGGVEGGVRDDIYAVAPAAGGVLAVTGRTESASFAVTPLTALYGSAPYLDPDKSGDEPFLVKLDPSLSGAASLVYGTYLGLGGFGTTLAVDGRGSTFVAGEVMGDGSLYTPAVPPVEAPRFYPYTQDAFLTARQGSTDCFLMQISPEGNPLDYSTFVGGQGNDRTYGLAVDQTGNLHWVGLTLSSDFPLRHAAQGWPGNVGKQNAFVARFGTF